MAPDELSAYDDLAIQYLEQGNGEANNEPQHLSPDATTQVLWALSLIWPVLLKYLGDKAREVFRPGAEADVLQRTQNQLGALDLSVRKEMDQSFSIALKGKGLLQEDVVEILQCVSQVFSGKRNPQYHFPYPFVSPTITVLLLTPLSLEFEAVTRHLEQKGKPKVVEQMAYEKGIFNGRHHRYHIIVAEPGKRNINMALATEKGIQLFQPQIALLVGIAGGVKDVKIGDVVLGEKTYGYESGKEGVGEFWSRPLVEAFSRDLLAHAKICSRREDWKARAAPAALDARVWFGPIAAGDKVLASTHNESFQRLKQHYDDTIALEMEAIGFAMALRDHRTVHGLAIRGISDLLDHKSDDFQALAAERAAAFAFELLYQLDGRDFLPDHPKEKSQERGVTVENSKNIIIGGQISVAGDFHFGDKIQNASKEPSGFNFQSSKNKIQESLYQFNPETALRTLSIIEETFPVNSKIERAALAILKGMCYYETDKPKEGEEEYLNAWKACPDNVDYKAKAMRVFVDRGQIDASQKLLEEILVEEPNNPDAWATKLFIEKCSFEEGLTRLPWQISSLPDRFRHLKVRLAGFYKGQFDKVLEIYKNDIENEQNIPDQITFSNNGYWLTIANLLTAQIALGYQLPPDGVHPSVQNHPLLKRAVYIFEIVFKYLEHTEKIKFLKHYNFWFIYAKYCLNGRKEDADAVLSALEDMKGEAGEVNQKLTAFALCQTGQYVKLNEFVDKKVPASPGATLAKGFACLLKKDMDCAKVCFMYYFDKIEVIDEYPFTILMTFLEEIIKDDKELNEYLLRLQNKITNDTAKEYVLLHLKWHAFDDDERKQNIDNIYSTLNPEEKTIYILIIGQFYLKNQNFDEALAIFTRFTDFNKESTEHIRYIETLYESHKDDAELLERLQNWRRNGFLKRHDWFHREVQLLMLIPEWEQILEVAESGIEYFSSDHNFWLYKAWALEHIGDNNVIQIFFEKLKVASLNLHWAISFSEVAFRAGRTMDAIGLLFPFALVPANKTARQRYFAITSMTKNTEWVENFSVVTNNCWVLLESDGTKYWEYIKPDERMDDWRLQLIGKHQDDTVEYRVTDFAPVKRYQISRIFGQYLGLHIQIMNEVSEGNTPGLGFQSVNLPKDDMPALKQTLIDLMGEQTEQSEKEFKRLFDDYHNQRTTFTQVARYYEDDPVNAYYALTNSSEHGLWIIPKRMMGITENVLKGLHSSFVLDFSAFLLFWELTEHLNLRFEQQFLISPFLVELLQSNLNKIHIQKPPEMKLRVTEDIFQTAVYPENYQERQIEFYQQLLNWIDQNCIIHRNRNKLKLIGELFKNAPGTYQKFIQDHWMEYCLDSALIANRAEAKNILIADDTAFTSTFKQGINVISSEFFLQTYFPDDYESKILPFLLKKKYFNLTISIAFLEREYKKYLEETDNCYYEAIDNIKGNTNVLIDHVFAIYTTNSKLIDQKRLLTQYAIQSCFNRSAPPKKTIDLLKTSFALRFKFLPDMVKFVLEDVEIALLGGLYL